MEKFFAAKNDETFNARDFRPRFRKTDVPVAQRQSNILKKVGLQLKPHWYCCKKLNNSCV